MCSGPFESFWCTLFFDPLIDDRSKPASSPLHDGYNGSIRIIETYHPYFTLEEWKEIVYRSLKLSPVVVESENHGQKGKEHRRVEKKVWMTKKMIDEERAIYTEFEP